MTQRTRLRLCLPFFVAIFGMTLITSQIRADQPDCNGELPVAAQPCGDPESCEEDSFTDPEGGCIPSHEQESLSFSDECIEDPEQSGESELTSYCGKIGTTPCMTEKPCQMTSEEVEFDDGETVTVYSCSADDFIGPPAPVGEYDEYGGDECNEVTLETV